MGERVLIYSTDLTHCPCPVAAQGTMLVVLPLDTYRVPSHNRSRSFVLQQSPGVPCDARRRLGSEDERREVADSRVQLQLMNSCFGRAADAMSERASRACLPLAAARVESAAFRTTASCQLSRIHEHITTVKIMVSSRRFECDAYQPFLKQKCKCKQKSET